MIIRHLTYWLLQNLCLTCYFAFPPDAEQETHLSRLWSLSLSWVEECKPFSYKTFLLNVLHRWLFIFTSTINNQVYVIQGTLGKLQGYKIHHKKCRNVIKSRAPGWNWIQTRTGKAKWGRSREAAEAPSSLPEPTWVGAAFMLIMKKCQEGQGKVPNSDHPVSESRVCLTFLCGEYSSTVLKGKQQEVSLVSNPGKRSHCQQTLLFRHSAEISVFQNGKMHSMHSFTM